MDELQRYLEGNFASAFDRLEDHMHQSGKPSLQDIKRTTSLTVEMLIAEWAASLDIKTKHDLMKSSIDAIR